MQMQEKLELGTFKLVCFHGQGELHLVSIHSSMGSTKSTREVRVGERPDACWQRDRSRNMAVTVRTATARRGTATAVAMARTATMVATSTLLTTGNGTDGSPPWRRRRPKSSATRPTSCPPWRRNAPTPSAEVTRNSWNERWRNVCFSMIVCDAGLLQTALRESRGSSWPGWGKIGSSWCCWASPWRWSAGRWTTPVQRACKVRHRGVSGANNRTVRYLPGLTLWPLSHPVPVCQPTNGFIRSWGATSPCSTWPGFHIPWSSYCSPHYSVIWLLLKLAVSPIIQKGKTRHPPSCYIVRYIINKWIIYLYYNLYQINKTYIFLDW